MSIIIDLTEARWVALCSRTGPGPNRPTRSTDRGGRGRAKKGGTGRWRQQDSDDESPAPRCSPLPPCPAFPGQALGGAAISIWSRILMPLLLALLQLASPSLQSNHLASSQAGRRGTIRVPQMDCAGIQHVCLCLSCLYQLFLGFACRRGSRATRTSNQAIDRKKYVEDSGDDEDSDDAAERREKRAAQQKAMISGPCSANGGQQTAWDHLLPTLCLQVQTKSELPVRPFCFVPPP